MNRQILYLLLAATVPCILTPAPLPAQQKSFDVATIKPDDPAQHPGGGAGWSTTANGLRVYGTLRSLIKQAYRVEDPQIAGGPNWLDRDRFEIHAKAPGPVNADELWPMLQSLLADRFRLAVHMETRQLAVYSLVVGKNGSKLQRPDDEVTGHSTGATLLKGTMDTTAMAGHLTQTLGRTVIDNTGLKGLWKFSMNWGADNANTEASIFTAIQEQLGLKLESTKGPVQVLVIDSAELPSEN